MYLTEETKKAFEKWMAWDITSVHPNTTKEFNKFALSYIKNEQNTMTKQEFVNMVKKTWSTSRQHGHGCIQEYYRKLQTIRDFCIDNKIF